MFLKKGQLLILIVNLIYLTISAIFYVSRKNYEFIWYILVILFFFALILSTNKKINYPNFVLWGLTLWGILHMAGGSVPIAGGEII